MGGEGRGASIRFKSGFVFANISCYIFLPHASPLAEGVEGVGGRGANLLLSGKVILIQSVEIGRGSRFFAVVIFTSKYPSTERQLFTFCKERRKTKSESRIVAGSGSVFRGVGKGGCGAK